MLYEELSPYIIRLLKSRRASRGSEQFGLADEKLLVAMLNYQCSVVAQWPQPKPDFHQPSSINDVAIFDDIMRYEIREITCEEVEIGPLGKLMRYDRDRRVWVER
jgi:hypothetical protein